MKRVCERKELINYLSQLLKLVKRFIKKKEFVEPAVKNIQKNNGNDSVSNEDIVYFILDMLDEVIYL